MTYPLSIKYESATVIKYRWNGIVKNMESILEQWKGNENLRNVLREAMLYVYMRDKRYKEAIDSLSVTGIDDASLELTDVNEADAMIYREELQNLHHDASAFRDLEPDAFLQIMMQAIEKDGGIYDNEWDKDGDPNLNRIVKLASYSKNYKELAIFIRSLYEQDRIEPLEFSGTPSLLNPVKFAGWGGLRNSGESFSFLPETFEGGYVEIESDNWGGELYKPFIMTYWSSGVKVVEIKDHSIVLELDSASVKDEIPISGMMVPTTECGEYVAAIREFGEFSVDIYYKSKDSDKRICLYSRYFCCK